MTWLSLFRRARLDSAPRTAEQPRRGRSAVSRPRRTHLGIEILEDRSVPAVFVVNSLADLSIAGGVNADGTIVGQGNTVTLRSAIQAANNTLGGNTIDLNIAGTYRIQLPIQAANQSDNQAGEFAILPEGDLTIQNSSGGLVTVDGGEQTRVFDINPGNTNNAASHFTDTFVGFTIEGGRAFDATGVNVDGAVASGGGIRDQGNQSLTLTDLIVTNNSATADGGGISMENPTNSTPWTLTINNSTILDNNSGDAGGGVETDGSGHVNITDSVIAGNTCVNQGAGIWLDAINGDTVSPNGTAALTITSSLVSANTARNGPTGGIGNAGTGAVTILDSTVANNSCGGNGGGFGDTGNLGTLIVLNSTFVANSCAGDGGGIQEGGPSTTINDSTITGNTAGGDAGGLDIGYTTFTLDNTIVAGNVANGTNMNFQGIHFDIVAVANPNVSPTAVGKGDLIGIINVATIGFLNNNNGDQQGSLQAPLNPDLGPLQNNGGPTVGGLNLQQALPTAAPLAGSPVIDAGVNSVIPTNTPTDERGFQRIVNTTVDIGAVEVQPPAPVIPLAPPLLPPPAPVFTLIPNADVPAGTVLPPNLVLVMETTVKQHGKKFRELVVTNLTGELVLGRVVLSGLSLKQYGQLFGLGQKQLNNLPTFDGSPAFDVFLTPFGQQPLDVPAGAGFTPVVVAGL